MTLRSIWEDTRKQLDNAIDERQAFNSISLAAKSLGFDYCAFGIKAPIPRTHPRVLILDSYPLGWMDYYRRNDFLAIDPLLPASKRTVRPIVWSDALFSSAPRFWDDARSAGLRIGVTQPCRGPNNTLSLLSIARTSEPLSPAEFDFIAERLTALSALAHDRMNELLVSRIVPDALTKLTDRELEVLRWTSEGCTAQEIAGWLSIAERTVNFHIANLIEKLDARNKLHAVAKASSIGII